MANEKELTKAQVADQWAKITIKVWQQKLVKLKAVNSNQLWQSFIHNVIADANGDVLKVHFAFLYYGKFIDMGVGKGTKIGGVKDNATSRKLSGKMLGNRRKPRKWYSKTLASEVYRLADILGVEYSKTITNEIVNGIENIADNSIAGGSKITL